jgi:hypothetical protein
VPRVLVYQVEQHSLQRGGCGAIPALSGLADLDVDEAFGYLWPRLRSLRNATQVAGA